MKNPTRLFDFMGYQQANFPQARAMAYRHEGKEIAVYSTQQIIDIANQVSCGLLRLGLKPGDKVATITVKNRPEWVALDLGMMQIGIINVPVYPTIAPQDYEYIFNDAEVKICFIGDDTSLTERQAEGSVLAKVKKAQSTIDSLSAIYTFDKTHNAIHWETIFDKDATRLAEVERIKNSIQPEDLATIIYTSGTTGQPKGVMLSHKNVVSNILTVVNLMPLKSGDTALSFLPLNHIFEKVSTYVYVLLGANIVMTGIDNLGGENGDLKTVKPHFFTCVPRLLEKVYEKIYNKGAELKGVKRALFFWALKLTDDFDYDVEYSGFKKLQLQIADKLVFSKWREALGGNIKGIAVGASPCPVKIMRVFCAAGVPVRECYGMTELSPGVSASLFTKGKAKLGYVGSAFDGIEIDIDASDGNYAANEGEILVTGDNVMMGYYNKPEETDKVIKIIGGKRWMFTGDIGKLDDINGIKFLKITDRKKELFKTSGGKYVAPAPIESKLRENFLVEQVMLVGDNQKFVSALIVPSSDALKEWCTQHGITWTHLAEVIGNQEVMKKYKEVIDKYNPLFAHVEQVKAFRLIPDVWEPVKPDGSPGELTPTMKLKRRVILAKYNQMIEGIYG
jgi:long-chain acyl-CoA synthetase